MPDAFGRLTEEELAAQAIRQGKMSPNSGMRSPYYAPPEQDYSDQEGSIKNQRAYANMLRGRASPEGRTVGPYDVYVGPNWGESLADVGGKALGGYLSSRADKSAGELASQKGTDAENRALAQASAAQAAEDTRVSERDEEAKQKQDNWEKDFLLNKEGSDQNSERISLEAKRLGVTEDQLAETIRKNKEAERLEEMKIQASRDEKSGKLSKKMEEVKAESTNRVNNIEKGRKLLQGYRSGAKSGRGRALAGVVGSVTGAQTDQGRFDQEVSSFAQRAARAELKAMGETRPTDADVEGMLQSMFGVGKDETVNINLLEEYLKNQVDAENTWREASGEDLYMLGKTEAVDGDDWYQKIFVDDAEPAAESAGTMTFEDDEKEKRYQLWRNSRRGMGAK